MKKIFLILAIAIVSFLVQEETKAQDSTETESGTSSFSLRSIIGFGLGWHDGGKLIGGVRSGGSTSIPPIEAKVCFTYPNTSIGLSFMTYPFKKMKGVGVGFDIIDKYDCNWEVYSEFYYGGLGQNTLGSPDTYWYIRDFVFSPAIEFNVNLSGRCKLSSKTNLLFGFWSYSDSSWSRWKRYWNTDISLEISLGH